MTEIALFGVTPQAGSPKDNTNIASAVLLKWMFSSQHQDFSRSAATGRIIKEADMHQYQSVPLAPRSTSAGGIRLSWRAAQVMSFPSDKPHEPPPHGWALFAAPLTACLKDDPDASGAPGGPASNKVHTRTTSTAHKL